MIINFYIREEYYRELYYLAMRLAEDYHESSPNEAMYYYKNVAPIECDICSCIVVNRAMYNHKKSCQL